MVTAVAKIEIKRASNCESKLFSEIMDTIQYQCWKLANKSITMFWDWQNFDFSYKERFGSYIIQDKGSLPNGYKKVGSDILNQLKEEAPYLHSYCKEAMLHMVEKKWKNDLKDVLKGNKSIASFNRSLPIELHSRQFMDSKKKSE